MSGKHERPATDEERQAQEDAKLEAGGYVGKHRAPDPLKGGKK